MELRKGAQDMLKILLAALFVVVTAVSAGAGISALSDSRNSTAPNVSEPNSTPLQIALMCFKSGEQISGMNKICYYNCMGSQAAITIKSFQLCPLSINQ
jgi:hypothetical protein